MRELAKDEYKVRKVRDEKLKKLCVNYGLRNGKKGIQGIEYLWDWVLFLNGDSYLLDLMDSDTSFFLENGLLYILSINISYEYIICEYIDTSLRILGDLCWIEGKEYREVMKEYTRRELGELIIEHEKIMIYILSNY